LQIQKCGQLVFGTPVGVVGPLDAKKMNSFPAIIGIATGCFAEWSKSIDDLLNTFAEMGVPARRHGWSEHSAEPLKKIYP
jgi:hypothetical protein